jgi:hypothetical protein
MPDDSASEETTLTKWHRQGRNLYRALGIIFPNSEVWQSPAYRRILLRFRVE